MSEILEQVREYLNGTYYFAFEKGGEYFLYRTASPKNVFILKSKSGVHFKRSVEKVVTPAQPVRVG